MNIKTIAVIGAGQMGAGIAQVAAMSGYTTKLFDNDPAALARGVDGISKGLTKLVEKGRLPADQRDSTLGRLSSARDLAACAQADLVIEAIVERFEPKADLLSKLDREAPPSTILASNTSSISITRLAASTLRPAQVIGMHFMNPVPIMKLVEVIRGLQTSDDTFRAIAATTAQMGKTLVLGVDSPGFIVNRILCPMINEAIFLLERGVTAADIDTAMKLGTNQPMGPLELADFVGLDTLLSILQILHRELGEDKYRPCPLLIKYVEAGWYGRKNGRGFYEYPAKS